MSIFKEEMYRFITDEENFNLAYEISELMSEVKETMINEFWDLVKEKLLQFNVNNEWDITKKNTKYIDGVLRDESCDYCFSLYDISKEVYFGIREYNVKSKEKAYDLLDDTDYVKDMKKGSAAGDWYYWKYLNYNFSERNTLKNIIPSKRDDFANEIAKQYWDDINEGKELLI